MYILVRESAPLGFAITSVGHASLACYLKFKDTPEVAAWLSGPFYKRVCMLNDAEFETAKKCEDHVIMTESALGGQEVSLAFKPRLETDYPAHFKFYRLYRQRY